MIGQDVFGEDMYILNQKEKLNRITDERTSEKHADPPSSEKKKRKKEKKIRFLCMIQ